MHRSFRIYGLPVTILAVLAVLALSLPQRVEPAHAHGPIVQAPPRPTPRPAPEPEPDPDVPPEVDPNPPSLRRSGGGGGGTRTPDPKIIAHASLIPAPLGGTITFAVDAVNRRGGEAKNVVVVNRLPSFLRLVNATASRGIVSIEGNTIRVNLDKLTAENGATITIEAYVLSRMLPPYNTNTITLSSSSQDEDPSNNRATFILWSFADMR